MQGQVVRRAHERGHFGVSKTEAIVRRDYWCKGLRQKHTDHSGGSTSARSEAVTWQVGAQPNTVAAKRANPYVGIQSSRIQTKMSDTSKGSNPDSLETPPRTTAKSITQTQLTPQAIAKPIITPEEVQEAFDCIRNHWETESRDSKLKRNSLLSCLDLIQNSYQDLLQKPSQTVPMDVLEEMLDAKLSGLSQCHAISNDTTYAAKAAIRTTVKLPTGKSVPTKNTSVVLVYPDADNEHTKSFTSDQTRTALTTILRPRQTGCKIDKVNKLPAGGLRLESSKSDLSALITQALKEKGLVLKVPTKRPPRLAIYHVPALLEADEIEEAIIAQNSDGLTNDQKDILRDGVLVKFKFGPRDSSTVHWIVQTTPKARKLILNNDHLYIGMSKCRVSDHIRVTRCHNCQQYGHMSSSCRAKAPACAHCAKQHNTDKFQVGDIIRFPFPEYDFYNDLEETNWSDLPTALNNNGIANEASNSSVPINENVPDVPIVDDITIQVGDIIQFPFPEYDFYNDLEETNWSDLPTALNNNGIANEASNSSVPINENVPDVPIVDDITSILNEDQPEPNENTENPNASFLSSETATETSVSNKAVRLQISEKVEVADKTIDKTKEINLSETNCDTYLDFKYDKKQDKNERKDCDKTAVLQTDTCNEKHITDRRNNAGDLGDQGLVVIIIRYYLVKTRSPENFQGQ
ncbi:unnamed protein product [Brassicogethes aeneus]|uniref:CCHC-type domain-containing protein n=1 Tax=Brassicogethes aeneus TaxID=1431903 RepID=A0A9P0FM90_BRAAE|nr:unnamed protein product [Brassicogethes aeneus]